MLRIIIDVLIAVGAFFALAGTIGVQLALALCYSFLPQAAPLCIYLRVMIPFVTWGKGAPVMCLALWPLSRPEKERACMD